MLIASRTQGTSCAFPPLKGEGPGKQRAHDSLVAGGGVIHLIPGTERVKGDQVAELAVVTVELVGDDFGRTKVDEEHGGAVAKGDCQADGQEHPIVRDEKPEENKSSDT